MENKKETTAEKPIMSEAEVREQVKVKRDRKPKAKEPTQAVEPKPTKFPTEAKINKYGFLYLDGDILAAMGISKGKDYPVEVNRQPDGTLTIQLKA
jgi:hypothetical protein